MDLEKYLQTLTLIAGRYFILAGLAFLLCYVLLKKLLAHKKIQQRYPKTADYLREIGYSILTISIFGFVPVFFIYNPAISKYTQFYHNIDEHSMLYFWAAYAFHPLEAIVEAGILVVFLFTIPIHKFHLLIFFFFMIVYNIYGHLGWELYPRNFHKTWIGRWINTSVCHNQHHQYFKGNYSLYFLFWDRWMGTLREDYDAQFEKVKAQ